MAILLGRNHGKQKKDDIVLRALGINFVRSWHG
jgi:hypothetical protein